METRSVNSSVAGANVVASGPNICRICLTNGSAAAAAGTTATLKAMESIFQTIEEYEQKSLYGILITICVPLGQKEMAKGMPERICRGCKWRLLSAYELYETCLKSDDKLRAASDARKQHLQDNDQQVRIKQELPEGNHDMTDSYLDASALLYESSYVPEAESTQVDPNDLLEEMAPTINPHDALFEENYKLNETGGHCCGICGQEFPYKSSCRSHIIVKHDPAKPFKCEICLYTMKTEAQLVKHKAFAHDEVNNSIEQEEKDEAGETVYTCKICTKTFTSLVRFKKHKGVHVAHNRPFKCDICLYRFATRPQLTQHVKLHRDKPDGEGGATTDQIQCEYCEEKLPGKRAHTMHVRRFHPQEVQNENRDKNEYKCIICSEAFARESVLNTHMKMHELLAREKEKEQRQELEQLLKKELMARESKTVTIKTEPSGNLSFNNSINIKKKSDADIAFVCMVCEEEFEERELLLRHQKKLHSDLQLNIVSGGVDENVEKDTNSTNQEEDAFKDDEESNCEADKDLPEDEQMVVDVDPIQLLGQSQAENEAPKQTNANTPLPKCELCQKTFMYNCLLQTHMKKSHSESKPFECKVCHMRFGYRGTLQKHELIHSAQNIRPGGHGSIMYKCKICSAKFLELKLLNSHLKTHRNSQSAEPSPAKKVEILQCSYCPQIFNGKESFEQHVAQQHKHMASRHNASSILATRKNPDPKVPLAQPKDEKERFFQGLSIVKLETLQDPALRSNIL